MFAGSLSYSLFRGRRLMVLGRLYLSLLWSTLFHYHAMPTNRRPESRLSPESVGRHIIGYYCSAQLALPNIQIEWEETVWVVLEESFIGRRGLRSAA
jgi:hypothetical protein